MYIHSMRIRVITKLPNSENRIEIKYLLSVFLFSSDNSIYVAYYHTFCQSGRIYFSWHNFFLQQSQPLFKRAQLSCICL